VSLQRIEQILRFMTEHADVFTDLLRSQSVIGGILRRGDMIGSEMPKKSTIQLCEETSRTVHSWMIHPVRMLLNAPIDWEMALEQGQA
jgi:hypothetical protein